MDLLYGAEPKTRLSSKGRNFSFELDLESRRQATLHSAQPLCNRSREPRTRRGVFIEGHVATESRLSPSFQPVTGEGTALVSRDLGTASIRVSFLPATRPAGFRLSFPFSHRDGYGSTDEKSWWPRFRDTPPILSFSRDIYIYTPI